MLLLYPKVIPIPKTILSLSERNSSAKYEIYFRANLPPLSLVTYYMQKSLSKNTTESSDTNSTKSMDTNTIES